MRGVGQRVGKATGVDPGPKAELLWRLSMAEARWSCGTMAAQGALCGGARCGARVRGRGCGWEEEGRLGLLFVGRRVALACAPEVGRPVEFVAGDLGRAAEFVAPRKGKICQAGPACQRQRARGRWTRTRGDWGTEAGLGRAVW